MFRKFEDGQIVALVQYQGELAYYVADTEFWFFDMHQRKEAFEKNGCAFPEIPKGFRGDLHQVTPDDAEMFLDALHSCKASVDELKANVEDYDNSFLVPSLLIDFDMGTFKSFHSEPYGFENYAGKDWLSSYSDFHEDIPSSLKYW
jgi:hypothetical protein